MAHSKTFVPIPKPVIPEFGFPGFVTTPEPEIKVQVPVPVAAIFPARTAVVELQITWSGPALEVVGLAATLMVTIEEEDGQVPLEMVQAKRFTPALNPVTPELNNPGIVTVPLPITTVHKPVPTLGLFPASVAVVPQIFCTGPAFETVGKDSIIIDT